MSWKWRVTAHVVRGGSSTTETLNVLTASKDAHAARESFRRSCDDLGWTVLEITEVTLDART
jgi:hypothetical protein